MVLGMNWDYFPIGTNYTYNLWDQPEAVIKAALDQEMPLLRDLGINTIRQYTGIHPRWVRYIYENYGIFTILNHSCARYGWMINGQWIPNVDYSDPALRTALLSEIAALATEFRDVPGILMYLLGNENNYGLSWNSAETQDLPETNNSMNEPARALYSLLGEAVDTLHILDARRPVAIANGDLLFIDLIASEMPHLDVFGANVYRGDSFGDLFQVVREKLGLPVLLTEFGADAFDALRMIEVQSMQTRYLLSNWQEIYEHSSGKGMVGNAIGGCTFQFSDGWWKFDQQHNLDRHDTHASWSNGGYLEDYIPGSPNMNEEWFGICAKVPLDSLGQYALAPRSAYFALQQAFRLAPLAGESDLAAIQTHFSGIGY